MKKFSCLAIACLSIAQFSKAQTVKQVKLTDFQLQSSAVVKENGNVLSTAQYQAKNYWFPVTVPSTVLSGLVQNKVYADPYIGMNNMLIPDASDSFNHQYGLEKYSFLPNEPNPWKKPYWYRTTFVVPASDKGKHFQLIFKGINYRAEVWLNGKMLADSSQMAGMFAEHSLNADDVINVNSTNILAVKIYPLDEPGLPAHPQLKALDDFYENGGPNGDIGKNVTMLCSVGWDWMPEVHDRNMGIWQPVYLRTSGNVVIQQPHIITALPNLPDTNTAKLSLHLSVNNTSNAASNGQLKITIAPSTFTGNAIVVTKNIAVDANTVKDVDLTADNIKEFIINKPHLWWPNGYGNPDLYNIRLQYINNNVVSDDTTFQFGIRTTSSSATTVNGWVRREFFVNGKRIHLTGGAWVPDMMLNRDSLRYDYELQLCRNSNINLVRIWGGGLAETDDFYEAADKYGMLVWQDFWVTGDTHGEFKGSRDYPLQADVYITNILSTIYRIRNHASLLVWTGGNEGHARAELYNAMRDNIAKLDGTRPFIPSSSGFAKQPDGWKLSWPDNMPSGVYSGGSYKWEDPATYYKLVNAGKDWVFKDETGLPSQPAFETLPKIINNLVPDSAAPYPLNDTWGYHDACTGNGHYELYYQEMVKRYGAPTSMKDFSDKMQLMNADGYRGIFEAADHKLNDNGGVMLWKLNAALPSVIWQVYDWYLNPNAGYYFMQRACEPVHIQLNLDDSAVAVVNRSYTPQQNLAVTAMVFDFNGNLLSNQNASASLKGSDVKETIALAKVLAPQSNIVFVVLQLKDASGKLVTQNVYCMQPKHDYTTLTQMSHAAVQPKVVSVAKANNNYVFTVSFTNNSKQLAYFVNPQIKLKGEEVLPSMWSNNYFSIVAGQTITTTVSCPVAKFNSEKPVLTVQGWNVDKAETTISLSK
jgi:hypothetical protein